MELNDAVILITGGSLGIGRVTAKKLAQAGAKVIITGRNKERLEKATEEIGAFPIVADVAIEADVERTYEIVKKEFGRLDVLINNAGIGGEFNDVSTVNLSDFESVFRTNVFGAAMMAKHAANIFKEQQSGVIINIASTAGVKGFERGTVYAGTKFALRGMTQCWQAELRKFNVRVMLINPSEVATAFNNPDRTEREPADNKLRSEDIAHAIKSVLEMDNRGFIPELSVWATNPWS
jgi:3-oxoacyl-[acyl-carrier protein] reductase